MSSDLRLRERDINHDLDTGGSYQSSVITTDGDEILSSDVGATTISYNENNNSSSSSNAVFFPPLSTRKPSANDEDRQRDEIAAYMRERISASVFEKTGFDLRQVLDARPIVVDPASSAMPSMTGSAGGSSLFMNSGAMRGIPSDMSAADNDELVARFAKLQKEHKRQLQQLQEQHSLLSSQVDPSLLSANSSMYSVDNAASGPVLGGAGMTPEQQDELKRRQEAQAQLAQLQQVKLLQAQLQQLQQLQLQSIKDASNNRQRPPFDPSFSANTTTPQTLSSRGSPRGRTAFSEEASGRHNVSGSSDDLADDELTMSQPKIGGSAGASFNYRGGGRSKGGSSPRRNRSKSAPKGSPRASDLAVPSTNPAGASPYSIPLSLEGAGGGPLKRGLSGSGLPPLSQLQQQEGYTSYASSTEFAPSDSERISSLKRPQMTLDGGAPVFIAPYISSAAESSDADLSSDDPSRKGRGRSNPSSSTLTSVDTKKKAKQGKQSSAPSRALTVAQQKEFLQQQAMQPLPPRPKTQSGLIPLQREWSTVVEQGDAKESSPYAMKPQLKVLVGERDVSAPLYHSSSVTASAGSTSSQHSTSLHSGHVVDAEILGAQSTHNVTTTFSAPSTAPLNQTTPLMTRQLLSTPVAAATRPQSDMHLENDPLLTPGGGVGAKKSEGDVFMTIGSHARRTAEQSLAPPPGMVQIPGAQPGIFQKDLSVKPETNSRPSSRSSERQPILMSSLPPALQGRVRYSLNAQLSAEEVLYARQQLEEYARMALQTKSRSTSPNELSMREFSERGFPTSGEQSENSYGRSGSPVNNHLREDLSGSAPVHAADLDNASKAPEDVFAEASEVFTESNKASSQHGPGVAAFLSSEFNRSGGAGGSFSAVPESILLSGGESRSSFAGGSDSAPTLNDGSSGHFPSRSPHRSHSPSKTSVINKAGFSPLQSSIIMNAMPIGIYSTTESRSRPSLSFGKASRKAWGKVSSPNSSILPIKRVGANGRLDSYASILLESNGGKFLTQEAEETFGHLLQPYPSLVSVGSSQEDEDDYDNIDDDERLTNPFASTEKITKTGQIVRSANLQLELEAAVRAAAAKATEDNHGVLPDGFVESVERKFLADQKQLKVERKAMLAKHRAAATDKAIAEATALQTLPSSSVSSEHSQRISHLVGPKRSTVINSASMSSSLAAAVATGSSGASVGSGTGIPTSRTTQSTKRSLDPSDPDYHYDFNSSLRSDGPLVHTNKTSSAKRPNTTGHPLLSGASVSARQYNPRTGGVSDVSKPNAQMQALLMSAKRGRDGILSSSLGGGGLAASRALRSQGGTSLTDQPPTVKEAWGSSTMTKPIISIQDSITLQRALAAEGRDTIANSASTKTPRSQAGVRGQFREKMGADPNVAAGPSSYPNAGTQALTATKKRAARVGGFDQMSGRPPMLEEINGPLQPAPNKYLMKSMGDLKSMRDLPMNVGFGYGLRSMDKEEKQRNSDSGQVLAYDITLADSQTLPTSPKLTIQSRAAWDTAENAANARQAMLDVAMKSTRIDYDSAIAAAASTTASVAEYKQSEDERMTNVSLKLTSLSGGATNGLALPEKKLDDGELKKDSTSTSGSPVQSVGALTTTDILRAAQFELLLAERNGDFTAAMDAFFSSVSKPAIQIQAAPKTSEQKKAPWQIALASGGGQLPTTPRSLAGEQLIDASLVLSPTGSLFNSSSMATPGTIRRELHDTNNTTTNNAFDRSGFVLSPGMEASIESQVLSPLFSNSTSGGDESRSTPSPSSGEGSPRKRFVRPGAAGTNASSRQRRPSEGKKIEEGKLKDTNVDGSGANPGQASSQEVDGLGFHFHRFAPDSEEDAGKGLDGDNFDASTINSSSRPGTSAAYPYFTSDGGYAFADGPMPNAMPSSRSGLRVPENIPKADVLLMTAETTASSNAKYSGVNADSLYSTPPDTAATALGEVSWIERAEASIKSSSGMNPLLATLLSKVEPAEIANVHKLLIAASAFENHYEPSVGEPYLSMRLNLNHLASDLVQVGDDDDSSELVYFSVCEVETASVSFNSKNSRSVRSEFALQLSDKSEGLMGEPRALNRRRLFQSVAVAPSPSFSSSEMSVHWPEMSMPLKTLSGAFPVLVEIWAVRKGRNPFNQSADQSNEMIPGQRLLYHTNSISVADLQSASLAEDGSKLVHFSVVKGVSSINFNDPELSVASITSHKAPSFGDYTSAGLRVNAVVAVDYSAGNAIRRLLLGAEVADAFEVQRVMFRKTAIKSARRSAQLSAKQRRESGVNGKSDDTASLENLPLALQAPTLLLSLPLIDVDDGSLHDAAGCTHPEATEMVAAAISLKEKRQASRAIKNHEIIDSQKMTIKVPPTTPIENLLLAASGRPSRMVRDGENSKMSINIDLLDDLLLTASGLGSSPSTTTDNNKVVSEEISMKQSSDDDSLGGVELDPYAAALAVLHEAIAPLLSLTKAQEKHKAAAQTLQAGFDLTSSLTLSPPGSTEGSMVLGADVEGGRKVFQGRSNPLQTFGFGATLRSKVYLTERSVLVSHNKQRASKNDAPIDEDNGKEEEEEEDGDDAEVHASRPPVRKPPTYDFATSLSTASAAASASIEAFVNERNIERSAAVRGEQLLTQQQGPEPADVYWDEAMAFLFPLTDPAEFEADPSAYSSSELLEAYCRSSRMVKPALFRHFAPAIERAMFYAGVGGTFSQENQHYTVLFILTAGGPDDVAEATEALLEASLLPVSIVVIGLTPQSDDEIADAALLRSESAKGPKSRSSSIEDFKRDDESLNADTVAAQAAISEAYTNEPPPLASMRQLCERLGQLQASEVTPIRGHVEFVSLSLKSLKDAAVASIAAASDGGATQTPELQAVRLALTRSVQRAVSKAVSFIPEHVVEYCQQQNVVPFHMPTFPSSSQQDQKRSSDEEEEFQSFGDYRGGDNEDEDDDDDDEIDNAVAVNTAAAARAGLIDPSALATESVGERPSRSSRGDRPRTVTFAGGGEAMGGLDDADTKPPVVADGSPIKDSGDAFLVPPVGVASPLLSPTALSLGTIDLMRNNNDSSGAFVESEDLMVQKVLAAQVLGQQKFLEEQSSRGLSTEEQQLQFLAFLAAQQEDLVQQAQALGLQLNRKKSPQSRSSSRSSPSRRSGSSARNDRESDNDRESSDDATWKKSPTAASRMPIIPGSVLLPPRARSRERKSSPSRHQVSDSDEPASSADDAAVPRYSRRKRRSQTPRLGEVTSDYISEKTERDKDTDNLRPETPHTTALIDAERSVPPDVVDKNARAAVALAIVLKNKGEELRRPSRRSKSPTSKRGAHKKQQEHQPPSSQDATGLADEHGSHTNENNSTHVSSSHRASSAGHFTESSHNNSNDHGHHGHHGYHRNDSKNDHHDLQLSSISTDHLIDGRRSAPHSSSSGPTQTPSSHAPSSTVVSPTTEANFSFKSFPTPSFNAYDAYLERIAKRGDQVVDEVDLDDLKSEDESDNVKKNREEREMLEQITRNVIKRIKTRDQQMEDMKRNASEDSKKFVEWETPLGRQLARRRMRSALAKQIERERKQRERAALARAGKKHHDDDSD